MNQYVKKTKKLDPNFAILTLFAGRKKKLNLYIFTWMLYLYVVA